MSTSIASIKLCQSIGESIKTFLPGNDSDDERDELRQRDFAASCEAVWDKLKNGHKEDAALIMDLAEQEFFDPSKLDVSEDPMDRLVFDLFTLAKTATLDKVSLTSARRILRTVSALVVTSTTAAMIDEGYSGPELKQQIHAFQNLLRTMNDPSDDGASWTEGQVSAWKTVLTGHLTEIEDSLADLPLLDMDVYEKFHSGTFSLQECEKAEHSM